MTAWSALDEPINVYYSYAQEDHALLKQLDKHLALLRRLGRVVIRYDEQITAGTPLEQEKTHYAEQAQIVLLLMSPNYIASDDCYRQMEQLASKNNEICIMLVLLRPTPGWEQTSIGHLAPLPMRNRPVTSWSNRDEAFKYIADELDCMVNRLIDQRYRTQLHSGITYLEPPLLHASILTRAILVKNVYTMLLRPDISTLVMTGLKGVGKSTLAAQIFHYAEEQRLRGDSPFTDEALWLKIEPTGTMWDLLNMLAVFLGQPSRVMRDPFPQYQDRYSFDPALELFKLITQHAGSRLIILDQFEEWVDVQAGVLHTRELAVAEWLEVLNTHPCSSRILLTSSIYPQGTHISRPMYMQEVYLDGMGEQEGIALLRLWNIQGSASDLRQAVERCKGHALALVLLDRLLQRHHLPLITVLNDPAYERLWLKDVQHNLLNYIYKHLLYDDTQRRLLHALSIYREAMPWPAIHDVMQNYGSATEEQTLTALGVLQQYNLLQTLYIDVQRYRLHPLVADFVYGLPSGEDGPDKQQAHLQAARYYEQMSLLLPAEAYQRVDKMHGLVEAAWHYIQAEQWLEGYTLMEREQLFVILQRWGKNTVLLELYTLLLPSQRWQPEATLTARIYNQLGENYHGLGQKKEAQNSFEKALEYYGATRDLEGRIKVLNNLGSIQRSNGQIKQALAYYQEAEDLCQNMPEHSERGVTLNNIGRAFQHLAQLEPMSSRRAKHYRQAIRYYQQALAIYRITENSAEKARTLNNLGEVYEHLQQPAKAYTHYQQSLQLFRELGERRGEGIVCSNLGVFYKVREQQQQRFEYYLQALHIFREIGDRWQEGIVLRNIGRLFLLLRQYEVALACFVLASDIYEELHQPERGDIPREIRVLLTAGQSIADTIEQVRPRAFQIVEDALKNESPLV